MNDTVFRARSVLTAIFLFAVLFRLPLFLFELKFKWTPRSRITTNTDYTEVRGIQIYDFKFWEYIIIKASQQTLVWLS